MASNQMVTVGCKIPNGLVLEVLEPRVELDASGKLVQVLQPRPTGDRVQLNGANTARDRQHGTVQYPFGLTPVPKDFWDAWVKYSKKAGLKFIDSGLVFAVDSQSQAAEASKERVKERTGLEALNADKPPEGIEPDRDQFGSARAA